jgi:hypothetical protein
MNPSTSTTARGSFSPDSASSVRARRRFSPEPRSTEKIAALSVTDTIEPSSSPWSIDRSRSHVAASPVTAAVTSVPTVASEIPGQSTGRTSLQPAAKPPSNRISESATTPIVLVSSTSSNAIQPSPSEPTSIPIPRNSTRPGTRTRPARRLAAIPAASSAPATRIMGPSLMRGESRCPGWA